MQKDSLSLIERGRRFPHPEHFMLLVERYGLTGYSLGDFFDQRTAHLVELKNQILSNMQFMELGPLPELLFCYKKELEKGERSSKDDEIFPLQFYRYALAWYYYQNGGDEGEFLTTCIRCLRMTQPHFGDGFDASESFLVQNELMILNTIACLYATLSQKKQALILFEQLLILMRRICGSHPVHFRNYACICHNAAMIEYSLNPSLSDFHIQRAKRTATQYCGIWTGCHIWRSELQLARITQPGRNLNNELWGLRALYLHYRPRHMANITFEDFMERREFLRIL